MFTGGRQTLEAEVHPVDWLRTQLDTFEQELREARGLADWDGAFGKFVSRLSSEEEGLNNLESKEDEEESEVEKTSCMTEVWRCFSGVLEGGIMHLNRLEGILGWGRIKVSN